MGRMKVVKEKAHRPYGTRWAIYFFTVDGVKMQSYRAHVKDSMNGLFNQEDEL
jgi:hypothetical protein